MKMYSLKSLSGLIVLLCAVFTPTSANLDSRQRLALVCAGDDKIVTFSSIESVKNLIEEHRVSGSELCAAEYSDGFHALGELLSGEVLEDVCSDQTYQKIYQFHLNYIHYFSPQLTDGELKAKKKLPKKKRTKPLPAALNVFFILFAKQVNAICTKSFVQRLGFYNAVELIAEADFEAIRDVSRAGIGSTIRQWIYASELKNLRFIKLTKKVPIGIRYKPSVIRLYNMCEKFFRPLMEELLDTVVKLNNLGYRDHFILPQELKRQLKKDHEITRWYEAFQYCQIMKNIQLVVRPKSERSTDTLGFLSAEKVEELRVDPETIHLDPIIPIEVGHEKVKFGDYMKLGEQTNEIRSEIKKHRHHMRVILRERTNPIVVMQKQITVALLRRFGLRPLPKAMQTEPYIMTLIVFRVALVLIIITLLVSLGYG